MFPSYTTSSHPNNPSRAILKVIFARDAADQYRKQITLKWDAEHTRAKALLAAGKKEDAKRALRRRKYLKDIIDKTIEQHDQLLQLAESIKAAESQKRTVDALERGKDALVQLNREMGGLKRVERIMEESAEAMADERVGYVGWWSWSRCGRLTDFDAGNKRFIRRRVSECG